MRGAIFRDCATSAIAKKRAGKTVGSEEGSAIGVEITQNAKRGVTSLWFPLAPGESREFLLSSDWHWDNPHCDRELLLSHLTEARKRKALALVFGDVFCAMEGKGDNRGAKNIRPEHVGADYLDTLVNTFIDWVSPWLDVVVWVSYGNHETGVIKAKETDLLARISGRTGIKLGLYDGWLRFITGPYAGCNNEGCSQLTAYYHHGYGGGGPVTKGVIGTNRRAAYIDGVDLVITGHVHESWVVEGVKETLTPDGEIGHRLVSHVQCATYKNESFGIGYHVQSGRPPKPMGGWWLKIFRKDSGVVAYSLERAN